MEEIELPSTTTNESLEGFINAQLVRFETELHITDESLFKLVDSVKDLGISGLEDKEGLKQVQSARKTLKKQRVVIEQGGKRLREFANEYNKAVLAREKQLVKIIAPTEERLMAIEDDYFEKLEAKRIEEERKESARIQRMIDQLDELDYAVDFHDLKNMTDEQFAVTLEQARKSYAEKLEQQRIEEEERQRQMQIEAERAAKEREEFERVRAEQEKKQKELEERQRQLDIEEKERTKKLRQREAELKAREEKIAAEERERKRLAEIEEAKKAAAEKALRDAEIAAEKKKYDEQQALYFGEDSDRFGFLAKMIETHFIHSPVDAYMKSDKGKSIAAKVWRLFDEAHTLCKQNSR